MCHLLTFRGSYSVQNDAYIQFSTHMRLLSSIPRNLYSMVSKRLLWLLNHVLIIYNTNHSRMFTTHRMQSPAFMSENAWLILSSGWRCVMNSSTLRSPFM